MGKYNFEGYHDPTAHEAYQNIALDEKHKFLVKALLFIINQCGFELVNRIQLKDRETGRVFR